jgi:DNA-binding HxlR family transcriptional regulator
VDRDRFAAIHCSIARAAGAVADPWTLLVLRDLFLGMRRYEELRRDLGVATNVLADRLDRLVAEGLAERHPYAARPMRYEYRLTDAGRELYGIVVALMAWGDRHRAGPGGAPMRLVHAGHAAVPAVTCDRCGEVLTPETVRPLSGPGGRSAPGTALVAEFLGGASGR